MPATDPAAITAARLQLFAPGCDYPTLAPMLAAEARRCEINTPSRVSHWLAQLHHESAGFTRTEESLSYSAKRLTEVWPGRFPALSLAAPFARNPQALANKVYAGRMGNDQPGDGWKYRGRGFIQITGKDGYRRASEWTGLDLVKDPDMAAMPLHACRIAADYWRALGLNAFADAGDIKGITTRINGGLTGLDERSRLQRFAATIWWRAAAPSET